LLHKEGQQPPTLSDYPPRFMVRNIFVPKFAQCLNEGEDLALVFYNGRVPYGASSELRSQYVCSHGSYSSGCETDFSMSIQAALDYIFDVHTLSKSNTSSKYISQLAFGYIYQSKLHDLFDKTNNVRIREEQVSLLDDSTVSSSGETARKIVHNLTIKNCTTKQQAMQLVKQANTNLQIMITHMSMSSSNITFIASIVRS